MVAKKLKACGEVYKVEFEFLAITFEELKVEVDRLKKQENYFKTVISDQEAIILQQKNVTEAIGFEQLINDEGRNLNAIIEGIDQDTCLEFANQLVDDPLSVQSELIDHIKASDILLSSPFNYYNFSVRLNIDEQFDIQNQNYIRYYKYKIEQILKDQEIYKAELEMSRSMIDDFRKASEKAER